MQLYIKFYCQLLLLVFAHLTPVLLTVYSCGVASTSMRHSLNMCLQVLVTLVKFLLKFDKKVDNFVRRVNMYVCMHLKCKSLIIYWSKECFTSNLQWKTETIMYQYIFPWVLQISRWLSYIFKLVGQFRMIVNTRGISEVLHIVAVF
jgi:hypothetical protein